jgi:hypothetical protein
VAAPRLLTSPRMLRTDRRGEVETRHSDRLTTDPKKTLVELK